MSTKINQILFVVNDKCLSKSMEKNRNTAISVLKKNGYVCDGTTWVGCTADYVEHHKSDRTVQCCKNNQYWLNNSCNNWRNYEKYK